MSETPKLGRCECRDPKCDHYGHWEGKRESNVGQCWHDAVRMVTVRPNTAIGCRAHIGASSTDDQLSQLCGNAPAVLARWDTWVNDEKEKCSSESERWIPMCAIHAKGKRINEVPMCAACAEWHEKASK